MPVSDAEGRVTVKTDQRGVATISFFHPSHNALPSAVLSELAQTITEAGRKPEVALIVIKSEGNRTFCAGASFDEFLAVETAEQGFDFLSGFANVINACRTCPCIIIGRVQGKAVGGGVGLASAFDYCFATQYSSIKLSELAVGIGPFVIGPAVERKIGRVAFSQLTLQPKKFESAAWAMEKGLYQQVFSTAEEMDEAIESMVDELSTYNPEALAEFKKILWEGTDHWGELLAERARLSGRLAISDFAREAMSAFKTGAR